MSLFTRVTRFSLSRANFHFRTYSRVSASVPLTKMEVKVIPALQDNYMFLLIDLNSKQAAAVDPVEPHKLIAVVENEGLKLTSVLTTHHHMDHSGGNEALLSVCPKLKVFGGDDRIPKLSDKVSHGQEIQIGKDSYSHL